MPLAASELLNIPVVERLDGSRTNIIVRGVVRRLAARSGPTSRSSEGRYFEPGKGECVVSRNALAAVQGGRDRRDAQGRRARRSYRVVGLFTAGGSAAESEVWVDLKDLARNIGREGIVSCVQLRAASPADLEQLKKTIDDEHPVQARRHAARPITSPKQSTSSHLPQGARAR